MLMISSSLPAPIMVAICYLFLSHNDDLDNSDNDDNDDHCSLPVPNMVAILSPPSPSPSLNSNRTLRRLVTVIIVITMINIVIIISSSSPPPSYPHHHQVLNQLDHNSSCV